MRSVSCAGRAHFGPISPLEALKGLLWAECGKKMGARYPTPQALICTLVESLGIMTLQGHMFPTRYWHYADIACYRESKR
jgi:hypothetical protein